MADFVHNRSKGRGVEFAERVEANDPTNAVFVFMVIDTSATDATLKDLDSFSAILADGDTAEVTNTNYARVVRANGALTVTYDDTNDEAEVDTADLSFSSIAAGDSWTDLVVGYDSDSTGGDDTNILPICQLDAAVTPDGSDITLQFDAEGIFKATD